MINAQKKCELDLFEQQLHVVQGAFEEVSLKLSEVEQSKDDLERKYCFLLQENTLLFNQLSVVQKELANNAHTDHYISSGIDNKDILRVKKHLSYRLGNVLVLNGKSIIGWIKLPWLLFREVRKFRLDKDKLIENEYGK